MRLSYLAILIFLVTAYLGLWRLDNTVFWDDETDTAITARNIVRTGHLTGWDGRNLYAIINGGSLDENLRPRNPPLGYIVAAVSFRVFGISTWSGRFPFVLAGLCSLILLAVALREDFGKDLPLWIYGMAVMAFSVSFLLHIRQCRYYSLTMLFSVLTFIFYRRCLNTGRLIYFILLSVSAVLLFYSNYLLCAVFLGALFLVCIVFRRNELRENWLKFSFAVGLFILATVPYAIYYRIWYRPDIAAVLYKPDLIGKETWYVRKFTLILYEFYNLRLLCIMPWMAAAGLCLFVFYYRNKQKNINIMLEWMVLIAGYVLLLGIFSPQQIYIAGIPELRYFASIIPFLAGVTGIFIWFIHQKTRVGAYMCLSLMVTTNLLNIMPGGWKFQWLLPAYISEIHHNYPTANGEAVRFLKENAQQDDKVLVWPDGANYPLMYYVGDKVKMCCQLDSATTLPLTKIRGLNAPLMLEKNFPDWIVFFGFSPTSREILKFSSRSHIEEMRRVQFGYRFVKLLDIYAGDGTHPELPRHSFGPKTDYDRKNEAVYIFKKINN